jgi:hypothetical protein
MGKERRKESTRFLRCAENAQGRSSMEAGEPHPLSPRYPDSRIYATPTVAFMRPRPLPPWFLAASSVAQCYTPHHVTMLPYTHASRNHRIIAAR